MPPQLDEDALIRTMVGVLREHPAEWLTFKRLSFLIALPSYDADFWAAIAEYRDDLFVINADKRLKLRPAVIEETALQGMTDWRIPARPVQIERERLTGQTGESNRKSTVGCYCNLPESEILADLKVGSVPDEALVNGCCWRTICRVRGLNFNAVDPETWREICQRRGYVQQRENPRGF
jgi:hypothetical protein